MSATDEVRSVALAIQERHASVTCPLPRTARLLRAELVRVLVDASDAGSLRDSVDAIPHRVKLAPDTKHSGAWAMLGGLVDGTRFGTKAPFIRDDGARIDFSMTIREGAGALELTAYNFLMDLPPELGPAFVRFDLNAPGHENDVLGLRSHFHPGVNEDSFRVPVPILSPVETLKLFIHHFRQAARTRKPRE